MAALLLVVAMSGCGANGTVDGVTDRGSTSAPVGSATPSSTSSQPVAGEVVTIAPDGVMGWWEAGWVQAGWDESIPVAGGEEYDVVGLTGVVAGGAGSALDPACRDIGSAPRVNLDWPPHPRPPMIAVTGVDDPVPRSVVTVESGEYRTAADDVLRGLGLDPQGSRVHQAVRADLRNDGTSEVVVVVRRFGDDEDFLTAAVGGYSVVFVRYLVDGDARDEVVATSVNDPTIHGYGVALHDLAAVADLNGDGAMEFAVAFEGYESGGTSAYEFSPNAEQSAVSEIFSVDCGP